MDKTQNKSPKKKNNSNPFERNLITSLYIIVAALVLLMVWLIFRPNNKTDKHHLFNIEMISELTTLECRYHNVAVYEKEGGFLGIGSEYIWFEYDVIVDVGIDINQVIIEEPTNEGVVRIYLPPAQILGATEDKSTISKPVCDLGWTATLTADEERQIINDGTQKLKNDPKTQEIIYQAYNSAKKVLEQYVINVGKLLGENYSVEWIKTSDNTQTPTDNQTESISIVE